MTERRVIAFDLGSTMAVAHNLGALPWSTWQEFDGDRQERAAATLLWLHRTFREIKDCRYPRIDCVVYERPFARGMAATRALWGLAGLVEAAAINAGFPVLDVTPAAIKDFATGSGSATKEQMISAAQILGYDGTNEHEADAFCLMCYAASHVNVHTSEDDDA